MTKVPHASLTPARALSEDCTNCTDTAEDCPSSSHAWPPFKPVTEATSYEPVGVNQLQREKLEIDGSSNGGNPDGDAMTVARPVNPGASPAGRRRSSCSKVADAGCAFVGLPDSAGGRCVSVDVGISKERRRSLRMTRLIEVGLLER